MPLTADTSSSALERARVALALVHHPVLDREGRTITAATTNIDLHDISRSAYTYGLDAVYVVHPVTAQRELAERIRDHWIRGAGGRRIPDRKAPIGLLRPVASIAEALDDFSATQLWTTSARPQPDALNWQRAGAALQLAQERVVLAFGTAWGLAPDVHAMAAAQLEPIVSPRPDAYNHLSVRAAVAIILDRLLSGR